MMERRRREMEEEEEDSNKKNKNNFKVPAAHDVSNAAAAKEQQKEEEDGLEKNTMTTWTDNYFDGQDDIVAVFDHDVVALEEMEMLRKVDRNFTLWWAIMVGVPYTIAILNSAFGDDQNPLLPGIDPVVFPILYMIGLLVGVLVRRFLYRKWWQEKQKQMMKNGNVVSHHWPHTAVTRTGVRHAVVPLSAPPNDVVGRNYVVVDIPFADIKSIQKLGGPIPKGLSANAAASSRFVSLVLASETDGAEYVMTNHKGNGHGPIFHRHNPCAVALFGRKVQLGLSLSVLKDPTRFQELVEALQQQHLDQLTVLSSSSSVEKGGAPLSSRRLPADPDGEGSNV
jgi:hypothetical protein